MQIYTNDFLNRNLTSRTTTELGLLTSKPSYLIGARRRCRYKHCDGPHGCEVASKYALCNSLVSAAWETDSFLLLLCIWTTGRPSHCLDCNWPVWTESTESTQSRRRQWRWSRWWWRPRYFSRTTLVLHILIGFYFATVLLHLNLYFLDTTISVLADC